MKKIILSLFLLVLSNNLFAQKAPYNVIFDVTSPDTVVHQMLIRWINEITQFDANAKIEVVFYAQSVSMVMKNKSVVADDVMRFANNKNIKFNVCEVSLKRNKIEKDQLLAGVGTVPDGIYEIISKQHEGWGYIKAAK